MSLTRASKTILQNAWNKLYDSFLSFAHYPINHWDTFFVKTNKKISNQSYKRNWVLKKSKLFLNSLTKFYFNLEQSNYELYFKTNKILIKSFFKTNFIYRIALCNLCFATFVDPGIKRPHLAVKKGNHLVHKIKMQLLNFTTKSRLNCDAQIWARLIR